MDRNKDFENFLGEMMSVEATDIESPNPSLVYQARARVMARKPLIKAQPNFFEMLIAFFRFHLKFYHVGISVLLIFTSIFYISEPNYNSVNAAGFIHSDGLSITNTTISVNSSTMLTSIPTLVIRN